SEGAGRIGLSIDGLGMSKSMHFPWPSLVGSNGIRMPLSDEARMPRVPGSGRLIGPRAVGLEPAVENRTRSPLTVTFRHALNSPRSDTPSLSSRMEALY